MGWKMGETFKREGTCVYLWLIHIVVWQKPIQYCKAIILQLKNFFNDTESPPQKKREREKEIYPNIYSYWSFSGGSDGKESAHNVGDLHLISGL